MKKFELNKFERLVKIVASISRIAMWVFIIKSLYVTALIIEIATNPVYKEPSVSNGNLIKVPLGNVSFNIPQTLFGNDYDVFLIKGTSTAVINYIFCACLLYFIRKIMLCLLERKPFAINCVKNLKALAYFLIISGVLMNVVENLSRYYFFKINNLEMILSASDYIQNVVNNVSVIDFNMIIYGIIIFVLSKIFEYGVYLQEEVDGII